MKSINITVANGQTTSAAVEITGSLASNSELAIVAIDSPSGLTTNTGTFEWSDDGTTWMSVIDIYSATISFPVVASKKTMLKPVDWCIPHRYIRLVLSAAVSADRQFKVHFREVE